MPPGINNRYLHFQEAIEILKDIKRKYQLADVLDDKTGLNIRYILERGFEKAIVSFIDIANHLIAEKYNIKPESYKDTISVLVQINIIDKSDKEIFEKFVSERNIITHNYIKLDYKELYSLLDHLDKLVEHMEKILSQLDLTEI